MPIYFPQFDLLSLSLELSPLVSLFRRNPSFHPSAEMPATAGRVRMPANNRVHSSAALQTHGIWQSAIGYDPYAPTNKDSDKGSAHTGEDGASADNAYANFQGLLALARITGSGSNEARGACKKCGRVGHLTFQCRNFLSAKDPVADKDKDDDAVQAAATAAFEQIKKSNGLKGESSDEEEEESDSSDSDVDPEIEKIIAARLGNKSKKRTGNKEDDSEEDKDSRRRWGRSKKRSIGKKRSGRDDDSSSIDDDNDRRKKRRRHRSSDDDDEEERRRHRHSRRKSRKDKKRRSHRRRDDSDDYDDESEEESDRRRRRHHRRKNSQKNDSGSDSDVGNRDSSHDRKRFRGHHARLNKRSATSESGSD